MVEPSRGEKQKSVVIIHHNLIPFRATLCLPSRAHASRTWNPTYLHALLILHRTIRMLSTPMFGPLYR